MSLHVYIKLYCITTAHPWEVSCGALDKQFKHMLRCRASLYRRLFSFTHHGLQAVQPYSRLFINLHMTLMFNMVVNPWNQEPT